MGRALPGSLVQHELGSRPYVLDELSPERLLLRASVLDVLVVQR